jgi:hypothetical protein
MSDLSASMAALRSEAEACRTLHESLAAKKQDLHQILKNVAAAYGGDPERQLPQDLRDAMTFGNRSISDIGEAQAFLTTTREAIERYCVSAGY